MKKYKVVYFTRTGNSRRIAERLGDKLSCRVIEITDNMNWEGIWGFLKGGYYASKNKVVAIKTSEEIGDYDELIVISPLWAGGITPDVKELFKTVEKDKVHLVVASKGSKIKNESGYKSVNSIVKREQNEDEVIDNLINKLK